MILSAAIRAGVSEVSLLNGPGEGNIFNRLVFFFVLFFWFVLFYSTVFNDGIGDTYLEMSANPLLPTVVAPTPHPLSYLQGDCV